MRNVLSFFSSPKKVLLLFLIGISGNLLQAINSSSTSNFGGLYFNSHDVIKDKRTSLTIGLDKPIKIDRGFNLCFDLNLRDERLLFGYVCRVVVQDTTNIDILSSNINGEDALWLVFGNTKRQLVLLKDVPNFHKGGWMQVRLSYLPQSKTIEMSLNGVVKQILITGKAPSYNQFRFYFGANSHTSFFTSDVAPIIIKDVVLSDLSKKELYHWALKEHGVNVVFDRIHRVKANVENPNWLVDKHVHWLLMDSIVVPVKPLLAFNSSLSELYVVNPTSMLVLDLKSRNELKRNTITYKSGKPFETMANQLIYNKYTKELWSYNLDGIGISKYNFRTNAWSLNGIKAPEPNYWHHNVQISPIDSSLVCFGGYGFYTYQSVMQRYKGDSFGWEKTSLKSEIQPRYLSAATIQGNEMYVFGGFGNKTGEQQLSTHSFCDLYSISLPDFKVTKKWACEDVVKMVYAQSLIADSNGKDFYTLGYNGMRFNTWIHLYKLNKEHAGVVELGDSIPYQFGDTESFCDVYYIPNDESYIAVTLHRTNQNRYQVTLYRLSYPAFPVDEVLQTVGVAKNSNHWISMVFILIILVFAVSSWVVFKKINQGGQKRTLSKGDGLAKELPQQRVDLLPSSISLIGGFQTIDRTGKDITALFTPHIRYILILIILYTYKTNKGISSSTLNEILWSDKSEASARNNRNVNINKLKSIIEQLDGLEINNDNSYWRFTLTPPFVCDYVLSLDFAKQVKHQPEPPSLEKVSVFLSMISQGLLLPNIQTEWIDSFKSEYSSIIMDALLHLAKQAEEIRDFQLLLNLADAMLIQDSIDEDALRFKCKALLSLGKKNTALSFYTSFCQNYKKILAEDYPVPFSTLS